MKILTALVLSAAMLVPMGCKQQRQRRIRRRWHRGRTTQWTRLFISPSWWFRRASTTSRQRMGRPQGDSADGDHTEAVCEPSHHGLRHNRKWHGRPIMRWWTNANASPAAAEAAIARVQTDLQNTPKVTP